MKRLQRRTLALFSVLAVTGNAFMWTTLAGCGPDNPDSDGGDASPDQTQPDVKVDVANDVTQDVVNDSDGGPIYDAAPILNFQKQYAETFCKAYGTYCFKSQLDSGLPDANLANCEGLVTGPGGGGLENAIGDLATTGVIDSGTVFLNATPAASCLAGLATLTLPQIPGSEYATLAQNCVGALNGTRALGAPCNATIECSNGFCANADGGKACVALSGSGGACGNATGTGNDQCMYRGWTGSTQLRCDELETDGGTPSNKCTPKLGNGTACEFEWECTTNTCDDNFTCTPNTTKWTLIPDQAGVCPGYFGADSGLQ